MPNIALIKDDDLALNLPADSITAVIAFEPGDDAEHPAAKSLILSTFRGFSAYHLADEPGELLEEIKARGGRADWLTLSRNGRLTALQPGSVAGWEEVPDGDATKLIVWFVRHDGETKPAHCDASDENRAALDAA